MKNIYIIYSSSVPAGSAQEGENTKKGTRVELHIERLRMTPIVLCFPSRRSLEEDIEYEDAPRNFLLVNNDETCDYH